jgi:sugar (pentulose or hexulose) kinase
MVRIENEHAPAPERAARYGELYPLYRSLIQAVWGLWDQSARLNAGAWT